MDFKNKTFSKSEPSIIWKKRNKKVYPTTGAESINPNNNNELKKPITESKTVSQKKQSEYLK